MRLLTFLTSSITCGILFVATTCFPAPGLALTEVDQPHVTASLVSENSGVTPGVREAFALRIKPDPKWHVYWRFAGDSGSAPILNWEVDGQSVDVQTEWPVPERLEIGPFVNYGYDSEVLFMSDLPIPENAEGAVRITLDAEWLVCQEECIPGNGYFELELPVVSNSLPDPSPAKPLFEAFRKKLPSSGKEITVSVAQVSKDAFTLNLSPLKTIPESLSFFPFDPGIIDNAEPQSLTLSDGSASLTLKRPKNVAPPPQIGGIVVKSPPFQDGSSAKEITFALNEIPSESTPKAASRPHATQQTFLYVLLAAYLGGLILNLMPCVFPVLSIKILGFVKKAGKHPAQVRRHGLAFGGGILISFWVLALVVRGLREAGEKLGWGFQLQNPVFVGFLILLLIAVALNLFGVFEVGSSVQRACGNLQKEEKESYSHSFLSGVLATLLATPCTAPFMGGAVAYGISSSFLPSLVVFSFLALGLSTPYLILSFFPNSLASLPRPGAWMETFKELMGFPVLLTALWLLWVFEKQSSSEELLALLLGMVIFSFGLWFFGKVSPPTAPRKKQVFGLAILLSTLALSSWIGIPFTHSPVAASEKSVMSDLGVLSETDVYGQQWYEYSPELLQSLLDGGKPVYLDFTAAWCVTCQVNKRVVFGSEDVRTALSQSKVILVKGDWTNEDPVITEALEKFDRLGVPLNVLYNPSDPENPVVFPSVLTPQIVLDAINGLKRS